MADENQKQDTGMSLDAQKYQTEDMTSGQVKVPTQASAKDEKEMKKMREKLENLKKFIINKYKFTKAIGIIPPQAAEIFDEENELSEEEKKQKPMHLVVILPDDKEKQFNEIKGILIKKIQDAKQKIWLNLFLEKDLWEMCIDSKYSIVEAIGMSFPLHDKGLLGSLRVAEIHKSLVLRKFEKYI